MGDQVRTEELQREASLVRRLLLGTCAGAAAALPFLGLLLLVRSGYGPVAELDGAVAEQLNEWVRPHPDVVAALELLSEISAPWTFRILVLFAAAVLWRYGRRRLATWAVVTIAVGAALGVLLKVAVARSRPVLDAPVSTAEGLSFPSGHALNSMLGTAVLLILVLPLLERRGRRRAWAAALLAVGLTALDRVALGVHFLTDVLAGWAAALALVVGSVLAFGTWRRELPAAEDSVEQEQRATIQLALQATTRGAAGLVGRAARAAAVLVLVMVGLGLLVTHVLVDLSALAGVQDLNERLAADRAPARNAVSNVFSRLADTRTVIPVMLAVAVGLRVWLGRWHESAFIVLAVSIQALVFVTTQLVIARTRPDVVQLDPAAPTSSFPSGHTSAAVALYGGLAIVLLWRWYAGRGRSSVLALAGAVLLLVPLAVAWSRLYRGLHFPLDVVGSFVQAGLALLVSWRLLLPDRLPPHLRAVLSGEPLDPHERREPA